MFDEWRDWAGFGSELVPGEPLRYQRAIFGKIHRASTDYRWIAVSPGDFDPTNERLEEELSLGAEDEPRKTYFLRCRSDSCLAGICYPSSAIDASGRRTPIEKQILIWKRPASGPSLLGAAFFLLDHAAGLNDSVWWDTAPDSRCADPSFVLPLGSEVAPPIEVDLRKLGLWVESGVTRLRQMVSPDGLKEFYAGLLDGRRPSVLPLHDGEISPQMLAALLLPVPTHRIENGLAVALGIPSRSFPGAASATAWDGLAILPETKGAPHPQPPSPDSAHRAGEMAAAVLSGRPPLSARDSTRIVMWGPSASGKTALLAQIYFHNRQSLDWSVRPTPVAMEFIGRMMKLMEENSFPPPTTLQREELAFRLIHRPTGRMAEISIRDRPGSESEILTDKTLEPIREAKGIVLLFDHTRDRNKIKSEFLWTALKIHTDRETHTGSIEHSDPRPVAVCLSKSDLRIESPRDLALATEDPDTFARQALGDEVLQIVREYFPNSRLFAVSSVGVRLQHGLVQPVVFLDDDLNSCVGQPEAPIHLIEPFQWILSKIHEQEQESATSSLS